MTGSDLEIGVDYLIQRGKHGSKYRGRLVGAGERPNRRSWKPPTKGWNVERRENDGGEWEPASRSIVYLDGYDRETGLFFVDSRAIRKTWKQHLADEKARKKAERRATKIRAEREAVEVERVDRFSEFGIEVARHALGGLYMKADEADRLLDRLDGRLERITIEATRREGRST